MVVKKPVLSPVVLVALLVACAGSAMASPTHQVWIPSTDTQPFKSARLELNNYFRASGNNDTNAAVGRDPNTLDIGVTVGLLPFEKFQLEAGFDYLTVASDPNDQHPWSGNIKVATPENSICPHSPALAVGIYNARPVKDVATSDAPRVTSGQNIVYFLAAKTVPALGPLPSLGRFSGGYYKGSRRALLNTRNQVDNDGVLLSWDRTLGEVSDKLWLGIDYMGGENVNGSVNFGGSWAFTRNLSLLFGIDIYTSNTLSGSNTLTTQVRFSFP